MASFHCGNTEIDYSLSGKIRFVRLEGELLLSDDYEASDWKEKLWKYALDMGLTERHRFGYRAWILSLAKDLDKPLVE